MQHSKQGDVFPPKTMFASAMKQEIDYVVRQHCRNGMTVLAEYTDRMKMLRENPNVDKSKFLVIEDEYTFARYNEVDGKELVWNHIPR